MAQLGVDAEPGGQLSLWPALESGSRCAPDRPHPACGARRTQELIEHLVRRWHVPPLRDAPGPTAAAAPPQSPGG